MNFFRNFIVESDNQDIKRWIFHDYPKNHHLRRIGEDHRQNLEISSYHKKNEKKSSFKPSVSSVNVCSYFSVIEIPVFIFPGSKNSKSKKWGQKDKFFVYIDIIAYPILLIHKCLKFKWFNSEFPGNIQNSYLCLYLYLSVYRC